MAEVTVYIDGKAVMVHEHETAAGAVMSARYMYTRLSPVTGERRAPYCMMGVCFECLLVIDGVPSRQGCLVPVREGMRIERQTRVEVWP